MTVNVGMCVLMWLAAPPAPPPPPSPAPAAEAPAAETPAPKTNGTPTDEGPPADVAEDSGEVTRYQFTGLDIDGELRTPALLQFLARIGGEFETVGVPHRSFMPELQATIWEDDL